MTKQQKISRKDQILQSLAQMLELAPGVKITTATLAKEVGVSEAALYRHFPSKARMYEDLIKFVEETLLTRINRIIKEETTANVRCEKILTLILTFNAKNPGMTRILTGDALVGENQRLRVRVTSLFNRIESLLKKVLREAQIKENLKPPISSGALANLLLACCEGRLSQFVRSEFKQSPLENWDLQWQYLETNLLQPFMSDFSS